MKRYIIKRIVQMIPVLILVSIFSFMIIHFAPGDPLNMYIRPDMTQLIISQWLHRFLANFQLRYYLWELLLYYLF